MLARESLCGFGAASLVTASQYTDRAWAVQNACMTLLALLLQAGTYIKEFVHSDEGRTQPHLASLLGLDTPAKILQLDVNEIHMDFLKAGTA